MAALDLADTADYATFLRLQLAARLPIERWAATYCPPDIRPPLTTPHLIDDLTRLGRPFSLACRVFTLPAGADPLGLAWAIAGSHMGNRAILAQLRRAGGPELPVSFLADPAMAAFWRQLRPRLEQPATPAQAAAARVAAEAVFAAFHGALAASRGRLAA